MTAPRQVRGRVGGPRGVRPNEARRSGVMIRIPARVRRRRAARGELAGGETAPGELTPRRSPGLPPANAAPLPWVSGRVGPLAGFSPAALSLQAIVVKECARALAA